MLMDTSQNTHEYSTSPITISFLLVRSTDKARRKFCHVFSSQWICAKCRPYVLMPEKLTGGTIHRKLDIRCRA